MLLKTNFTVTLICDIINNLLIFNIIYLPDWCEFYFYYRNDLRRSHVSVQIYSCNHSNISMEMTFDVKFSFSTDAERHSTFFLELGSYVHKLIDI
jgi:hypothetical protein